MGTEVESAEVIRQRIADQLERQQKAAQALRTSGSFITFARAILKVNGVPVPNNQAEVRVLAAIPERAWYDGAYDPDEPQVPACYALDSGEPHPEASDPQSDTCMGCPKNKWGTAPPRPGSNVPGKGKACREGARLIVMPANIPLKSAPMYTAKVPVTSLNVVQTYMDRCANSGRMMGEFIGVLSVVEDKRSFFKVGLEIKEHTPDLDPILLMNKMDAAMELAMQPYPNLNSQD